MREHQQILTDAGKDEAIASRLGVKPFNVRDWRLRNSIPAERWQAIVAFGWSSFEELAAHVAAPLPANDTSSQEEAA